MRHHKSIIRLQLAPVLVTSLSTASIVPAADDAFQQPIILSPFNSTPRLHGSPVDRVDPSKYGTATKEYGAATKGGEGKCGMSCWRTRTRTVRSPKRNFKAPRSHLRPD